MQRRASDIVLCGYDMVTPLGEDLDEQWNAFSKGRSGLNWVSRFEVDDDYPVKVSGEVPTIDFSVYDFYSERDEANWFSPVIFHSMLVAKRALKHAGLQVNDGNAHKIATTFSSAIGGLDAMIMAEAKVNAGQTPHPFTNPNGCLNLVGGKVSILTGTKGPIFSPVAACATGAASVSTAAMLLKTGMADAVVAGACDFPVIKSLIASFASMNGAFKFQKTDDRAYKDPACASRPFSKDRKGFVVSEGAAAAVVTTREYADANGLPVRAVISGIGMTSDAKHFVAPSLSTVTACIEQAIADAGIDVAAIQAVNAHAASTGIGDATEVKALSAVFGKKHTLPVSANKSQIGHTMGASSAIEMILAVEGMKRGVLLSTINHEPDPAFELDVVAAGARTIDHDLVLSNSFGFGGCNVCLVLSRGDV